MELKAKKVTYFEVGYSELQDFIKEQYGHEYSIVANLESHNDSKESISALTEENDEDDQKAIENYKATGSEVGISLWTLMNDMADRGVIEEGDYLIDICW
jgi:hypothetical protein